MEGKVDVGGDVNGVYALFRHGAVAAGAPDSHAEQRTACHKRALTAEHHARGGAGVDMKGQRRFGRRRILQDPGRQHGLGPGEALLIRLEHKAHCALKLRLVLPQQRGGA